MIEFAGISKSFGAVAAIRDASLALATGELLAVLGPSGCGKTTLLRLAGGYEQPDAGSIRIHERDVTPLDPERRNVGMVFQNYALFPHMSVLDNVEFGLRMRRVAKPERRKRAGSMLAMTG